MSVCGVFCALMVSRASDAQITITDSGQVNKYSLSLEGLKADRSAETGRALAMLEKDLVYSGWFRVEKGATSVSVSGTLARSGGGVSLTGQLVWRAGAGSKQAPLNFVDKDPEQLAHRVSDAITLAITGKPGIASSQILFLGTRSGKKEVYRCNPHGGAASQLTADKSISVSANWLPGRKGFVYTSFRKEAPSIYYVDLVTNKRRQLTRFPGLNVAGDISPDGREMLMTLSKDGNPEIYVMDLRTLKERRLTKTPRANEASPTWSPDGRQIAFVSDSRGSPQIYVMNRDGSGRQLLTREGRENVSPDWGPDGRIAYSSRRFGRYHIFVIDPRTGVATQLTKSDVDHEDPSWARDGRHIVYCRTQAYRANLYVLDTGGDPQVRLTKLDGDWYAPACSP